MTRVSKLLFTRSNRAANLTIVLLLSFGLGAAALLSAALDRFLLHPLDVPHPETLVRVVERHPPVTSWEWFPYSLYDAMRPMHTLREVAAEGSFDAAVSLRNGKHEDVRPILAQMVSGDYFSMLGTRPAIGRALGPADEHASATGVPVVLSHRFWTRAFASSRTLLGSTLTIQGKPFVIVGIMPKSFFGSRIDESPDVWLPFSAQPLLSNKSLTDPDSDRHFAILARLQAGVTLAQAQQEFAGIYRTIHRDEPTDTAAKGSLVPAAEGTFALRDSFHHALTLLLWGLAALLLMMCANVGGLLLARTTRRERDTAVRIALGASRTRLLATALLESAALGLAGGCGGLALAYLGAPLFVRLLPLGSNASPVSLAPNLTIASVALGLALVLSILFGAVPAWLTSRAMPQHALRRGTSTSRSSTLSRALLALQTALTLVLLVETGLMLRTFSALRHTDPGFDVDHVVTFTLVPEIAGPNMKSGTTLPPDLSEDLVQRVQQLSGVRGATLSGAAPMQRIGMKTTVALPGRPFTSGAFLNTSLNTISSNFFETMAMPLLSGRALTVADSNTKSPAPVSVVINQAFARTFFPGQSPLGRTFGNGSPGEIAKADKIVVGVVGDSKYRSLREPLLPIYYAPMDLRTYEGTEFLYVRAQGPPETIIAAVRNTLAQLDPNLPFSLVETMQQQVSESLWQERLLAVLAALFSIVSILMAATGLYGLLAYDASQRTREFGIRIAVGAQRSSVASLLLQDLVRIVLPGAAAGVLLCVLLSRLVASTLYGVRPSDPVSFSAALLAVFAIAAAASCLPVWRTLRIDPAVILRDE
jgi:macrolide transport system ATP-binding/permease protein